MKFFKIKDKEDFYPMCRNLDLSINYTQIFAQKDGKFFIRNEEVDLGDIELEEVETKIVRRDPKAERPELKGLYIGVGHELDWTLFEADGTQVVYLYTVPGGWSHMEVIQE